ncbi:hypothetical protein BJ684DRAFT_18051 [Piptocephalis cylindrospora]|uniref:Uncharacterized protein n=1 Tax=Piptocephalis cylindrospora TaxID=1907219 RepID=A0A4V1IXK2_9FUNG|nr:hypothetical protein BJ684DRAFT_18051 [Piptocephalis cylindrospora]|eukprot:RKP11349.1 hypothetical protein BJ684DRAFT_18051 [Piptocephalis cylindrospora]
MDEGGMVEMAEDEGGVEEEEEVVEELEEMMVEFEAEEYHEEIVDSRGEEKNRHTEGILLEEKLLYGTETHEDDPPFLESSHSASSSSDDSSLEVSTIQAPYMAEDASGRGKKSALSKASPRSKAPSMVFKARFLCPDPHFKVELSCSIFAFWPLHASGFQDDFIGKIQMIS